MISDIDVTVTPYNTRHKLISLPSLGIQLPVTHATRLPRRLSPPSDSSSTETPPFKKIKRSHQLSKKRSNCMKSASENCENKQLQSPDADVRFSEDETRQNKRDLDEINDDVVEAIIRHLQSSGNRPHLAKELAVSLGQRGIKTIEQSANPSAIISSRLSSYMKRPWSTALPCPISKHLELGHPRRTYYHLIDYHAHHFFRPSNSNFGVQALVSPPISSASSLDDEADEERRRELSPSPEVDLSSPEYDDEELSQEISPSSSFCLANPQHLIPRNHRSTSPPLEKDEKEFTQTARGMQKRKLGDLQQGYVPQEIEDVSAKNIDLDALFGRSLLSLNSWQFASSPPMKINSSLLKRQLTESIEVWSEPELEWDMRSPENIELHELDELFENL